MLTRGMKDSGVEWIGEIPKYWDLKRMKYILTERKMKNDPIITEEILSLSVERGVFPYSEKTGGGNKAKTDLTAYKVAFPNDIVINSMNVLAGAVGLSRYQGAVSPVYYTLYDDTGKIDINYYYYLFQTEAFQRSLLGLGNGIMMKESSTGKLNTIRMRIPMEKLFALRLPLPPKDIQNKIVEFIGTKVEAIDKIITNTKQSIGELKKYRKTIITETVTKGIDATVQVKDSGIEVLGKINVNYNVIPLGYLGTLQNGISKSGEYFGEGYPFVSYGDVYNNRVLPFLVKGLVRSTKEEQNLYSIKKGDIFFTRTSEIIEEVGMASVCLSSIEQATFAGFLIRFRPNYDNQLISEYARYYLESTFIRDFFAKEMNLVTRASLSQPLLKRLPIILPNLKEQKRIVSYLDIQTKRIDTLIQDKEKVIIELQKYKKSLTYEYVTGKKEV